MLSGETMMQVPDTDAEVLSVAEFDRELERGGPFQSASAAIRRAC